MFGVKLKERVLVQIFEELKNSQKELDEIEKLYRRSKSTGYLRDTKKAFIMNRNREFERLKKTIMPKISSMIESPEVLQRLMLSYIQYLAFNKIFI